MLHVSRILAQGHGLAKVLLGRAATVELDWDVRQKSRFECTDSQGRQLGVFLPRGTMVRGGDVLLAEDGSMVRVLAAPQPVMVIRQGQRGSPFDLLRAAYHLGNRHVAIELQPDHLKIEPDHVLADMLRAVAAVGTALRLERAEGVRHQQVHGAHGHEDHQHPPRPAEPHNHEHEHDTQVHDHEHDSHRHGEHGQSHTR